MGGEAWRAPSGGLRSCACSRTGWGRHHHQEAWCDDDKAEEAWRDDDKAEEAWRDDDKAGEAWRDDDKAEEAWRDDDKTDEAWRDDDKAEEAWCDDDGGLLTVLLWSNSDMRQSSGLPSEWSAS